MAREYWPSEWCAWPSRRFIATVKGNCHAQPMTGTAPSSRWAVLTACSWSPIHQAAPGCRRR